MACTHWLTFLQTAESYDNGVYTLTDLPPDCRVLWQWCVHTDWPSSRLQSPMTMVCTHWLTFLQTADSYDNVVYTLTDLPSDCRVLWQCCVHTDWPSLGLQSPMTMLCTHWLTFLQTAESYDNGVYTLTDLHWDCRVLWQCCVHTDWPSFRLQSPMTMLCTHWLTFLQTADSYDNVVYTLTDLHWDCRVLWQWCVHTDWPSLGLQSPMTMVCTHWLTFIGTAESYDNVVYTLTDLPPDCRVLWQWCVHTDWPSSGLQSPMTMLCTHWLTFLQTADSYDNVVYTLTDLPPDCRLLWQCCVHTDWPSLGLQSPMTMLCTHWLTFIGTAESYDNVVYTLTDLPPRLQSPMTMLCTHWLTFLQTAESYDNVVYTLTDLPQDCWFPWWCSWWRWPAEWWGQAWCRSRWRCESWLTGVWSVSASNKRRTLPTDSGSNKKAWQHFKCSCDCLICWSMLTA